MCEDVLTFCLLVLFFTVKSVVIDVNLYQILHAKVKFIVNEFPFLDLCILGHLIKNQFFFTNFQLELDFLD